jgi:NIPSNAP
MSKTASTRELQSSIVELRQYTLHPGKRDLLIELFERHFIDPQEEIGAELIGQFRDLENPDRFVWLRGFPDMSARGKMLEEFYTGPIWKAHREEANATMIDSDNVLLLRTAWSGSGFSLGHRKTVVYDQCKSLVTATICYFDFPPQNEFFVFFKENLLPILVQYGAPCLATFVTESSHNNFPRLAVREGENVFVWFSSFANGTSYNNYIRALEESSDWLEIQAQFKEFLIKPVEILKLSPTPRSKLV